MKKLNKKVCSTWIDVTIFILKTFLTAGDLMVHCGYCLFLEVLFLDLNID